MKAEPHGAGSRHFIPLTDTHEEELWPPPLVSCSKMEKALHSRQCMAGVLCWHKKTEPASTI